LSAEPLDPAERRPRPGACRSGARPAQLGVRLRSRLHVLAANG